MKETIKKEIETANENLRRQIMPYVENDSLNIVNSDVAVVITSRSEWGSSGGIGYYDQVRVFCGSQSNMREWQWRDRYSASNDEPNLRIDSIGTVNLSEQDGRVVMEVELVNNKYGNRTTKFVFNSQKTAVMRTLSPEKQSDFSALAEREITRIMAELNQMWECKPRMVSAHPMSGDGYISYRRPSVKQKEFRPEIGVAAFVVEEQIDHRGSDPQIRHELYVVTTGEKAECLAEDHAYNSEGGAFLTILEINLERIVINTKRGKRVIALYH